MTKTSTEKAIEQDSIVRDREKRAADAIKAHLKVAPEKLWAGSGGYDQQGGVPHILKGVKANG